MKKKALVALVTQRHKMTKSKWGETKAVDEFCARNNIKVNLYPEPHIIKL